jgi:hypothetical protein
MKLLHKTLHYVCRTNEEPGMWCEKILCDILNINFNSKRKYINQQNYPNKLKKDLNTIKPFLQKLQISEHLGNQNTFYDFKTTSGETVSIKTNINGNRACPQTIGQTTLQKFNEKTNNDFETINDYKSAIFSNTQNIINIYLNHLFCCKHLISFKFDKGTIYHFNKTNLRQNDSIKLNDTHTFSFNYSKNLDTWNNSMSLSVNIKGIFVPFAEFQIHNSRNTIQCRFNLDTIVSLIQSKLISNISFHQMNLKHKYAIKVQKRTFEDLCNQEKLINKTEEQTETQTEEICQPYKKRKR